MITNPSILLTLQANKERTAQWVAQLLSLKPYPNVNNMQMSAYFQS